MAVALGITIVWALLFVPIGVAFQWLVLGPSARHDALQVAPVTGLAIGLVLLGVVRQAGVSLTTPVVQWGAVVLAAACIAAIVRWKVEWRTRDLAIGALLVALAAMVLQMPVWNGTDNTGPPGWGTGHVPAAQVAAIDAIVRDDDGAGAFGRRAVARADDHYDGWETLAGFTSGLGAKHHGGKVDIGKTWNPFLLFGVLQAVLLALVVLPLLAFARWRGVGLLGRIVLVLVGVASPVAMVSLGLGQAAAVAAVPFATLLLFAILVARRDRGWYAVAIAAAGAVFVLLGPLALLPAALTTATWVSTRRSTREHLAATDQPVTGDRPLLGGGLVLLLAIYAGIDEIGRRSGLPLAALHHTVGDALTSWPFAWLESDLSASAPADWLSNSLWFIGPLLLAAAAFYGARRREMRELAIIAGVVVTLAVGTAIGVTSGHRHAGITLIETTWVLAAPMLAAVCVRTVGLARSGTSSDTEQSTRAGRSIGGIAALLIAAFVLFTVATSVVSGGRTQLAPTAPQSDDADKPTLLLASDPWLPYFNTSLVAPASTAGHDIDEHVTAAGTFDVADPDMTVKRVLSTSDPLGSDGPAGFTDSMRSSAIAVREFIDTSTPKADDATVAAAANDKTNVTAAKSGDLGSIVLANTPNTRAPLSHHPVERLAPDLATGGGILVPGISVARCRGRFGQASNSLCGVPTTKTPKPAKQAVSLGCTPSDQRMSASDPHVRARAVNRVWGYGTTKAGALDGGAAVENGVLPAKHLDVATSTSTSAAADTGEANENGGGSTATTTTTPASSTTPGASGGAGGAAAVSDARRAARGVVASATTGGDSTAADTDASAGSSTDPAAQDKGNDATDSAPFSSVPMLGEACFAVPVDAKAGVLRIHLRDVGYLLTADAADRNDAHAELDGLSSVTAPQAGPKSTAHVFETSTRGASVTYGNDSDALQGSFDITPEGSFPGGIDIATPAGDSGVPGAVGAHIRLSPSYDPWGETVSATSVADGIQLVDVDGDRLRFGTLAARPVSRGFVPSCDVFLPIQPNVAVETGLQGTSAGPGLRVALSTVSDGSARLVVSNYLQGSGYSHQVLVDWVEEYQGLDGQGAADDLHAPYFAPDSTCPATVIGDELTGAPDSTATGATN